MYTFNNSEAIKNKFDNELVKRPKKLRFKKRITKIQDLDFQQMQLKKNTGKNSKKVLQEKGLEEDDDKNKQEEDNEDKEDEDEENKQEEDDEEDKEEDDEEDKEEDDEEDKEEDDEEDKE